MQIWPPKSVKDSGSRLHTKLKEAIMQTGMDKNLFGNHPVTLPGTEPRGPPPAFASDPLKLVLAGGKDSEGLAAIATSSRPASMDIVEIDGSTSAPSSTSNHETNFMKSTSSSGPGATTRKSTMQVDRQNSEVSYLADDEDGKRKKYTKRGSFRHKFLRSLLPFWSSSLPTLPVSAPPRKDALNADEVTEGRQRHHKSSRMDPRKLLLIIAIMACMATMGILYYRIAQSGLDEELPDNE
ncbi:unnamed protein product [Withania somnifera]